MFGGDRNPLYAGLGLSGRAVTNPQDGDSIRFLRNTLERRCQLYSICFCTGRSVDFGRLKAVFAKPVGGAGRQHE